MTYANCAVTVLRLIETAKKMFFADTVVVGSRVVWLADCEIADAEPRSFR